MHRTIVRRATGRVYVRYSAWRGGPAIGGYAADTEEEAERLAKADAAEMARRYGDARAGSSDLSTVAGVLDAYERSTEFKQGLSASTQKVYGAYIADMKKAQIGQMKTIALNAPRAPAVIARWHQDQAHAHGPRSADQRLAILRRALGQQTQAKGGALKSNPAAGHAEAWRSDRSELIWEKAQIEAFDGHIRKEMARIDRLYAPGDHRRLRSLKKLAAAYATLHIALSTGMRREDLSVLTWRAIEDGALVYTGRKGARRARTAGKHARVTVLPILAETARVLAYLAEIDGPSSPWVITSSRGGNYKPGALGEIVNEIADQLKLGRHLHDAKGTFVTRLKNETNLTNEEIAGMVDWTKDQVDQIIRRYVAAGEIAAGLKRRFRRKSGT